MNLKEFLLFSNSWKSYDQNNPPCDEPGCLDGLNSDNYNILCDYQEDGIIDENDLWQFANEWLWKASWRNAKDYNGDCILNLKEFLLLSNAWKSYDRNNPPCDEPGCLDGLNSDNYNILCDYQKDGIIDVNDLRELANEWLWKVCWQFR